MRKHIKGMVLIGLLALLMVVALPAMAEAVEKPTTVATVIDLTPIIQVVMTLLVSLITIKVVPWIKARTTTAQQESIGFITRTLVYAAEQIYGSGTGKKKLMYVKSKLQERGYDIDVAVIEAAVRELTLDSGPKATEIHELTAEISDETDEDDDEDAQQHPDNPVEADFFKGTQA